MQPDYSPQLIRRSLDAAARLASIVIPIALDAFAFSTDQVRLIPPGGNQDDKANLQALPNLFRLNMIKLVGGHNKSGAKDVIRRKGSPNNGLWLGIAGDELMARVYKVSRRYAVKRSGRPQEYLITQARYQEWREQRALWQDEPLLDALIMWQSHGYEIVAAFVVIPDGWDEEGRLRILAREEIALPDSIDQIAQFTGGLEDTAVVGGNMPIVMPMSDLLGLDEDDVSFPFEGDDDLATAFEGSDAGLGEVEATENNSDRDDQE